MDVTLTLQIVMVVSAVLMIISVLLQRRGASLGAGFGGSGELYTTRRGLDKNLFEVTIFLAVAFVMSIVALLVLPNL
jgi:preprotein translocase, secG subunit